MFTASMSAAEMSEAYSRLTATATGKGKGSTREEVKICYVTVCLSFLQCFGSIYEVACQPERIGKSSKFKSVLATMVAAKKLGASLLSLVGLWF